MTEQPDRPSRAPDYDLADSLEVGGSAVHAALADPRRTRITALLLERAATAKQLAEAIGRSPQATTHHLTVLRDAGLVRVVRTRRVRATTQRWWGRTARVFVFTDVQDTGQGPPFLREALAEIAAARDAGVTATPSTTIRYARIPSDRAAEWFARLAELANEFAGQPREGEIVHGMVLGVFPTAWRGLRGDDADHDAGDDTGAGG